MSGDRGRRERRQFEPPPWEPQQDVSPPTPASEPGTAPAPTPVAPAPAPAPREEEPPAEAGPDDASVDVMLMQLRAEEPRARVDASRVTAAAGVFLIVLGVMLLVWGFVALLTTFGAPAGAFGAAVLLLFGGLFCALGGWAAWRGMRQRGVV